MTDRDRELDIERFYRKVTGDALEPWQRDMVRSLAVGGRRVHFGLSTEDVRKLRARFLEQWPEVARWLNEK